MRGLLCRREKPLKRVPKAVMNKFPKNFYTNYYTKNKKGFNEKRWNPWYDWRGRSRWIRRDDLSRHSCRDRSNQSLDELFVFASFNLIFPFHCFWSVWILLGINQMPRAFRLCINRTALIMSLKPFTKIPGWARVITSVQLRLNYVNMIGHTIVLRLECRPVK